MAKTKQRKPSDESIAVKGAFRLQITEDGRIVSDTGWQKNQVTYEGWQNYLASNLMNGANSKRALYIALGTGTVPAASTNALPSELAGGTYRATIGANTSVATATTGASAVMSGTFASGNAGMTGTLQNIGLFSASSGTGLMAGNTYATQTLASNQAVNVTYTIGFA